MPAISKNQATAAAIALHAPQSKLRGASKQMAGSMSRNELEKFARTKRSGLPQHKSQSESVERIKALISEGRHKEGCECGFCKNMRLLQGRKKKESPEKDEKIEEPKEPPMQEGRDDIGKLHFSQQGKAYARRSGLSSMKRQPKDYINMVAAETNQNGKKQGFRNFDAEETTSGSAVGGKNLVTKKRTESQASKVVRAMLGE